MTQEYEHNNPRQDEKRIVLALTQGMEHELLTEQDIFNETAIMYPAYHAARDAVDGITDSTDRWTEKHDSNSCSKGVNDLYGFANNVIAFCGSRGQGKTSTMMSFAYALGFPSCVGGRDKKQGEKNLLTEWIGKRRFFVLPPIDPTMLAEGKSVIELILTKLFDAITEFWSSYDGARRGMAWDKTPAMQEDEKYAVLRLFQSCREGIQAERGRAHDTSDFDAFERSSDIFALKTNLHEIIQYLFKQRGWDQKKSFLIIQLDDTDMQLDDAYNTLEDVRKYLTIPHTVILMAADITQLRALANLHYRNRLHATDKTSGEALGFNFDYMAAKYIDKLIPVSQTIHLPTMRSQYDLGRELFLRVSDLEKTGTDGQELSDIQTAIFKQIYEKTGLVFVRHESYLHEILPSTLRGYMHLYRFLSRMEKPKSEAELKQLLDKGKKNQVTPKYCEGKLQSVRQKLQNLSMFEQYFINDWIPSRITDEEHRRQLLDLKDVAADRLFLYALLHLLPKIKPSEYRDFHTAIPEAIESYDHERYREFLDGLFKKDPIKAYGLYLNQLDKKRRTAAKTEDFNLVFAIGTYISIQLHKLILSGEIDQLPEWNKLFDKNHQIIDDPQNESFFSFEFPKLTRMTTGGNAARNDSAEKNAADSARHNVKNNLPVDKTINDALEEAFSGTEIDRGLFAQSCLALLSDKGRYDQSLFSDRDDGLALQDSIVYLCCNWDVLHQMYDYVSKSDISGAEGYREQSSTVLKKINKRLEKKNAVDPPTQGLNSLAQLFGEKRAETKAPISQETLTSVKQILVSAEKLRFDRMSDPNFFDPSDTETRKFIYNELTDSVSSAGAPAEQAVEWNRYIQTSREAAEDSAKLVEAKSSITNLIESLQSFLDKQKNNDTAKQNT